MAARARNQGTIRSAEAPSAEAEKNRLISELGDVRHRILKTAAGLGPGARDEVFLGTWSTRDLVAHLIGWDYTNTQAIDEVLAGRLPRFFEAHDRDWRTYNALLVETYMKTVYRELLRDARRSHRMLIERVLQTPAVDLGRDMGVRARGWKVTIERLLKAELSDERTHLEQLEGHASHGSRGRTIGESLQPPV